MYVEFYIFCMFARGKDLHFECSRDIWEFLYDYEGFEGSTGCNSWSEVT